MTRKEVETLGSQPPTDNMIGSALDLSLSPLSNLEIWIKDNTGKCPDTCINMKKSPSSVLSMGPWSQGGSSLSFPC